MDGRDLADMLNYIGMERDVRELALKEKLATPEKIAVMCTNEVCNLVIRNYKVLCASSEKIILVKNEDYNKVRELVKTISR